MNSRERVLTALKGGQPDKVPFVDSMDARMQVSVMQRTDFDQKDLADFMGFDALTLNLYPPFFVKRQYASSQIDFVSEPAIHTREDLDKAVFPQIDAEYMQQVEQFLERYHQTGYALGLVTRIGCAGILNSMGIDGFSYAMADDPEMVEILFDRYVEWVCELLDKTQSLGFDFVKFSDDIAYKTGPMFSPATFREFFLPRMKIVADQTRLPWIYHSDGNLLPVFDDLISLGMNAVNPIEPGAMDIFEIKRIYGKRICIHGNIDLHYTLTLGTPEEVDAEVKEKIEKIGAGGGYIVASANSITDYCKVENVLAMRDAIQKYRNY